MADLERRLSGARVTWVDRAGSHVRELEGLQSLYFSQYGPYGERPEVCNLLEFNMDQLDGLNNAQQMAFGVFLHGIGFPSMELLDNVWHGRHGLVRLEDAEA